MNHEDSLTCHRCFRDKLLIDYIKEEGKRGWCDWCGGRNVYVVPLYMLGDIFRDAISIYEPDEPCIDSISFLLQEDWEVFSDKIEQDPDLMQELTVAILKAGLDPKEYFSSDYPDYNEGFRSKELGLVNDWHYLAEAYYEGDQISNSAILLEDNKDDIYSGLPHQLEVAFEDLSLPYEPSKIFYRARKHKDRFRMERFALSELGAPSPDETPAGRANRKNEPVLYLSSDFKTALAEVRAWKGAAVAVADVKVKNRLHIVSLLNYEFPKSPFFNELLQWEIQLGALFYRLADELSMPLIRAEDEKLYFSTQYLCDWVKKAGYDGIEYPSAMGQGNNIVIFNPENIEVIALQYVRVTEIKHDTHDINEREPLYEERPFDYLFSNQSGPKYRKEKVFIS